MPLDNSSLVANVIEAYYKNKNVHPIPLKHTDIKVTIEGGMAVVTTERRFRNDEHQTIEVTLTIPVPVNATVIGLSAQIGERTVLAQAKSRVAAKETYEAALDEGKTTVLHEELLRGVHMISVGHVAPGKDVVVINTWTMPLCMIALDAVIRIPTTVGEVFGHSPLHASDALQSEGGVVHLAQLEVICKDQVATVLGEKLSDGKTCVNLDHPIDIKIENWRATNSLKGKSADGRNVTLTIKPASTQENSLNASVLADCSGSMDSLASGQSINYLPLGYNHNERDPSKWTVMIKGLIEAGELISDKDRLQLIAYSNDPKSLGSIPGKEDWNGLISCMPIAAGGTQTDLAIAEALKGDVQDILLITDGKTNVIYGEDGFPIQDYILSGKRFTVVLIGEDSLEASVGHLAVLTGGEIFICQGTNADQAIKSAFQSMRRSYIAGEKVQGNPQKISQIMGGMEITAVWSGKAKKKIVTQYSDPIGALACSLAISKMDREEAAQFAEIHGIVCHLTSLVLVDQAAEIQDGIPVQRKVALSAPRTSLMMAACNLTPMNAVFSNSIVRAKGFYANPIASSASSTMQSFSGDLSFDSFESVYTPPENLNRLGNIHFEQVVKQFTDINSGLIWNPIPPNYPTFVRSADDLNLAKGKIDWNNQAERLRKGDISGLDWNTQQILTGIAANNTRIAGIASELGVSTLIAAILLIARIESDQNRSAARFIRKLLVSEQRVKLEAGLFDALLEVTL